MCSGAGTRRRFMPPSSPGPPRSRRSGAAAGRAPPCQAGRAGRGRRCSSAGTRAGRCRSTRPSRLNDIVAPPSRGLASSSVTSCFALGERDGGRDARPGRRRSRRPSPPFTGPAPLRYFQRSRPARAWAATRAFSPPGSDIRPSRTACGLARDALEEAAVDAGHRARARRAAAVDRGEQPQSASRTTRGRGRPRTRPGWRTWPAWPRSGTARAAPNGANSMPNLSRSSFGR